MKVSPTHVVMGNASGDLDSAICAIALAYARGNSYVPLINMPFSDLLLHQDLLDLLQELKIEPSSLAYREAIPELLSCTQWVLVDHNALAPEDNTIAPRVVEIIDHHQDEKVFYPGLINKNIKRVGSCATLVAEETFERLNRELAYGLLMTILIDTGNLQDKYRVTSTDIEMVNRLRVKAQVFETDTYYQHLLTKRRQIDLNRPDLILRKDFKRYRTENLLYGISSLPPGVEWTRINLDHWYQSLATFLQLQQVDFLILLMPKGKDKQAIFYTPNEMLLPMPELFQLQEELKDKGLIFYNLKEPLPRKDIQPLISALLIGRAS